MSVSEDIYRELILQHSRHPRHFGDLADATHAAVADNPLCGDSYQVRLKVDAGGVIREAAFEGVGCAISKASASLMLDAVIGRTREIIEICRDVWAREDKLVHDGKHYQLPLPEGVGTGWV